MLILLNVDELINRDMEQVPLEGARISPAVGKRPQARHHSFKEQLMATSTRKS